MKFVGIGSVAVLFTPLETLASPYYEGKTITIVVGVGQDGGYDRMARMLQRYLSKHILGKKTFADLQKANRQLKYWEVTAPERAAFSLPSC